VGQIVGEEAYQIWHIYRAGSAFAFECGWIFVAHALAARPMQDGSLVMPGDTRIHHLRKYCLTSGVAQRNVSNVP
jgi:hypothetical protein